MLLNYNVATIKRHQTQPFPDLWPADSYDSVLHSIYRNQPTHRVSMDSYHFAIKPDLKGPPLRVILQPNGVVLHQGPDSKKSLPTAFQSWLKRHQKQLRAMAEEGIHGTIVGKMGKYEDRDVFCVYYVQQDGSVYLDSPNLERILQLKRDPFDGEVVAVYASNVVVLHLDKVTGEATCRGLYDSRDTRGAAVGFPIVSLEPRLAEDGTEAIAPKLITTPIHMRYMAFQCSLDSTGDVAKSLSRRSL